jgi:hypothetical protein
MKCGDERQTDHGPPGQPILATSALAQALRRLEAQETRIDEPYAGFSNFSDPPPGEMAAPAA